MSSGETSSIGKSGDDPKEVESLTKPDLADSLRKRSEMVDLVLNDTVKSLITQMGGSAAPSGAPSQVSSAVASPASPGAGTVATGPALGRAMSGRGAGVEEGGKVEGGEGAATNGVVAEKKGPPVANGTSEKKESLFALPVVALDEMASVEEALRLNKNFLFCVAQHLDGEDLLSMIATCKDIHGLLTGSGSSRLWKMICVRFWHGEANMARKSQPTWRAEYFHLRDTVGLPCMSPTGRYVRDDLLPGSPSQPSQGTPALYRALDREAGTEVGWIELHLPDFVTSPEDWSQLDNQVQTAAQRLSELQHPRLVSYHAAWPVPRRNVLVLLCDLPSDRTLRSFRRTVKGHMKLKLILRWLTQILDALGYLHSQEPPIIHNSVAMHNVYVEGDGSIKLAALHHSSIFPHRAIAPADLFAPTKTAFEFVSRMAPEVADDEWDARADVFSLGILLIEAITGEENARPECQTATEVLSRLETGEPPAGLQRIRNSPDYPAELTSFIEQCLLPVHMRPTAGQLQQHELFSVPVVARPTSKTSTGTASSLAAALSQMNATNAANAAATAGMNGAIARHASPPPKPAASPVRTIFPGDGGTQNGGGGAGAAPEATSAGPAEDSVALHVSGTLSRGLSSKSMGNMMSPRPASPGMREDESRVGSGAEALEMSGPLKIGDMEIGITIDGVPDSPVRPSGIIHSVALRRGLHVHSYESGGESEEGSEEGSAGASGSGSQGNHGRRSDAGEELMFSESGAETGPEDRVLSSHSTSGSRIRRSGGRRRPIRHSRTGSVEMPLSPVRAGGMHSRSSSQATTLHVVLKIELPDANKVQVIEFDYDTSRDTVQQVAEEMVSALGLPSECVSSIEDNLQSHLDTLEHGDTETDDVESSEGEDDIHSPRVPSQLRQRRGARDPSEVASADGAEESLAGGSTSDAADSHDGEGDEAVHGKASDGVPASPDTSESHDEDSASHRTGSRTSAKSSSVKARSHSGSSRAARRAQRTDGDSDGSDEGGADDVGKTKERGKGRSRSSSRVPRSRRTRRKSRSADDLEARGQASLSDDDSSRADDSTTGSSAYGSPDDPSAVMTSEKGSSKHRGKKRHVKRGGKTGRKGGRDRAGSVRGHSKSRKGAVDEADSDESEGSEEASGGTANSSKSVETKRRHTGGKHKGKGHRRKSHTAPTDDSSSGE